MVLNEQSDVAGFPLLFPSSKALFKSKWMYWRLEALTVLNDVLTDYQKSTTYSLSFFLYFLKRSQR